MKRRTAFAGIAGASSLLAVAALVSPVVTNAATPTSHSGTAAQIAIAGSASAPATATSRTTVTTTSHRLTSTRAEAIVRKQARGGHVTDVRGLRHGGYDSFAVRIAQADGSTLTGYIDRESGVVFDWKRTAAPRAIQTTTPSTTGSDDAESDDDYGTDEQGDSSESESEDVNDDQGEDGQHGDSSAHHDQGNDQEDGNELDD